MHLYINTDLRHVKSSLGRGSVRVMVRLMNVKCITSCGLKISFVEIKLIKSRVLRTRLNSTDLFDLYNSVNVVQSNS